MAPARSTPIPGSSAALATPSSLAGRSAAPRCCRPGRATLLDLLGDEIWWPTTDGAATTLRLKSSMYHRFHAPADLQVEHVTALSRGCLERQSARPQAGRTAVLQNERAVIRSRLRRQGTPHPWCRWPAITVPASACTGWTYCSTCATGANEVTGRTSARVREMRVVRAWLDDHRLHPGGYRALP